MKPNLIRFATVAAMAAGMVFAQTPAAPSQQSPEQRREGMRQRMFQELNLTAAQQQQATTIFDQARQNSAPLRQQLKQNRDALQAAIQSNNTTQIHALASKQATLQSQITEMRADAMAKFYTTLTPEQRTKAEQLHQQMRQRWEQRMTGQGPTG